MGRSSTSNGIDDHVLLCGSVKPCHSCSLHVGMKLLVTCTASKLLFAILLLSLLLFVIAFV